MQITQISATPTAKGHVIVFGLGADNKVYIWRAGEWQAYLGS